MAQRQKAEVVAGVREYQGHVYAEIRQFVPAGSGGSRPTGKGVTFKAGLIPTLIEAIELGKVQLAQGGAPASPGSSPSKTAAHDERSAGIVEPFSACPSCGKARRVQGAGLCPDCARQKLRSS